MSDPVEAEGIAAWAALLQAHAALVPTVSRQVEEATGLPLSWYDVLLELQGEEAGRLRIQQLGARVVLSRSRVSRIVDEMIAAGLLEGVTDPTDRRSRFAVITPAGRAAFDRAGPVYLRAIGQRFAAHLTAAERRTITRALRRVVATAEQDPTS